MTEYQLEQLIEMTIGGLLACAIMMIMMIMMQVGLLI